MTVATPSWDPLILTVAPNGAYKTHGDHPKVPLTAEALAVAAHSCLMAGASMIHLHVRNPAGRHILDTAAYQAATKAIRKAVGDELVIQITSEAGKIYSPEEQMAVVREVRPEAVSVAIRELVPDSASELKAAPFFEWLHRERIMTQLILYSAEELVRYQDLRQRGVLPPARDFLLFVLGRYSTGQQSDPRDVLPFLEVLSGSSPWAVCAFGVKENACLTAAIALSGHARTGFENNLYLPDGRMAQDNAQLVGISAETATRLGRPLATARQVRERFG
ncbi:MAG: 3-keto-5-aminohexanoate cleavage protein [Betaproteobacteria bacterium]|nr:3-keto-5-aminohexanoate cleavage protein [Betaproteobacteria bacterium]